MDEDETEIKAGRPLERFIGVGVFGISALFFILAVYFLIISFENNKIGLGVIVILLVFSLIGYSLGVLSIRLIMGSGRKGTKYLLSNSSLLFWGTIFGVAGIVEVFFMILHDNLDLLIPAIGSLTMGLGSYKLAKKRRLKNEL